MSVKSDSDIMPQKFDLQACAGSFPKLPVPVHVECRWEKMPLRRCSASTPGTLSRRLCRGGLQAAGLSNGFRWGRVVASLVESLEPSSPTCQDDGHVPARHE